MKILTLNTWQERGPWQKRWEIILEGIKQWQPEIIGFQEVFNFDWAEEVRAKSGYPYIVFHPEPSGLMLLSKFPVIRERFMTMKNHSPREEYLRYALFAELQAGRSRLAFFNTHLSWKPEDTDIRAAQIEELLGFMEDCAPGLETVAVGDFNAAPGMAEIRMMPEHGFTDTFAALHPGDEGLTWDNKNPFVQQASVVLPDRRIDYIWRKNAVTLLQPASVQVVYREPDKNGIFASDHYGVLLCCHSEGEARRI